MDTKAEATLFNVVRKLGKEHQGVEKEKVEPLFYRFDPTELNALPLRIRKLIRQSLDFFQEEHPDWSYGKALSNAISEVQDILVEISQKPKAKVMEFKKPETNA